MLINHYTEDLSVVSIQMFEGVDENDTSLYEKSFRILDSGVGIIFLYADSYCLMTCSYMYTQYVRMVCIRSWLDAVCLIIYNDDDIKYLLG